MFFSVSIFPSLGLCYKANNIVKIIDRKFIIIILTLFISFSVGKNKLSFYAEIEAISNVPLANNTK